MGQLLNEIANNTLGRKRTLKRVLEQLDASDRQDLIEAINNVAVPASAIRAALARRSVAISLSAIYRYRNGEVDYELE